MQRLPHAYRILVKNLYSDLEEQNLVNRSYQIYVTDMTQEHSTSYLNIIDIEDCQIPVNTCVLVFSFGATNRLITSPYGNHLNSKCK
jgi:hypothetical protein